MEKFSRIKDRDKRSFIEKIKYFFSKEYSEKCFEEEKKRQEENDRISDWLWI